MRISAVCVLVQNLARSLQFTPSQLPQSTRELLQPPSSTIAGIIHSRLDYKDFSQVRKLMSKQHRLLETTGEPLLLYLAVSWNLVLQQGREPE